MKLYEISQKVFLGVSASCMLVTIVVVMLINTIWTPMSAAAFCGLLWAEAVLFGGLYYLNKHAPDGSSVFLRVGGSFVIVAVGAASFVISIIFFPLPVALIPGFIAIQLVLFLGLVILVLAIFFLEKRFRVSDMKAKEGISYIAQRSMQVAACAQECPDAELRRRLERCADNLKFMDSTVRVQPDSDIDSEIQTIRESIAACNDDSAGENHVKAKLAANVRGLELAIASRKDEATLSKRGGF